MFKLHANKTRLELIEVEQITSGSYNVNEVKFCFSEDWNDTVKTVVFKVGSGQNEVIVKRALNVSTLTCLIPQEVLLKPNVDLYCGIYGKRAGTFVIPTIWANLGTIKEGVDITDPPPLESGVSTFNYRAGDVLPEAGDYTADMVGAVDKKGGAIVDSLKFVVEDTEIDSLKSSRETRASTYTEIGEIKITSEGVTIHGLTAAKEQSEAVPLGQMNDVISTKQDKVTGSPGQILGFDKDGNLVAQEEKGVTTSDVVGIIEDYNRTNPVDYSTIVGKPEPLTNTQLEEILK